MTRKLPVSSVRAKLGSMARKSRVGTTGSSAATEPTPDPNESASEPEESPRGRLPRRATSALLWALTVFCVLAAVLYLPTLSSVAFALVAILACPSWRVRALIPVERVLDRAPGRLASVPARAVAASALFLLACMAAPLHGELSLNSYLDLQNAEVLADGLVEYGREAVDVSEHVTCTSANVTVRAKDPFVPAQVGPDELIVMLEEGPLSREQTVTVTVKDTRPPVITLKRDVLETKLGETADVAANVASVSDPVDGRLREAERAPKATGSNVGLEAVYDNGWYQINDSADYTKPGTYEVEVVAFDQHGNKATKTFGVEVLDPLEGVTLTATTDVLEYSNKPTDATKLVECSDPDATVTADELTPNSVGKATVSYTLSKGGSTRTQEVTFSVRDTRVPAIALAADEVAITKGDAFDPYANIASVADEVDGALARVDVEPTDAGDGWYTVTGAYDAGAAGRYQLTVVACDRNGNHANKEFALVVSDPPVAAAPVDAGRDYVLNTNTGKFHYPSCRDVGKIANHNRQDVHMTRDEVVSMGYSPCGHCKP